MQPETLFLSWGLVGVDVREESCLSLSLFFFLFQSLSKLSKSLRGNPNDLRTNVSELRENRKQQRGTTADRKQPCVECYSRPHGMARRAV